MTKKALTILLTALLFLSAVTLGGTTVFRVSDVAVSVTVVSQEAKTEVTQLKEDLEALYKEKNIFSVQESDMMELMANYPYFRIEEFEKVYPDRIIVTLEEEAEVYAVENADGSYYILGATGTVLAERNVLANRLDKAENVCIKGVSVSGEKGGLLSGDACWQSLFVLCKTMDETLGGIRSNVVSVQVLARSPETFYLITMREGVQIYVGNPFAMTEERQKVPSTNTWHCRMSKE